LRKNLKNHELNKDDADDVANDAIIRSARNLELQLKYDKKCTIEGSLVFNENLQKFNKK